MKLSNFTVFLFFVSVLISFTGCNKGKSIILEKTAEEVTKMCPMEVDYMTTLVNCEFVPDKTLKYNYVTELDKAGGDLDAYRKMMEKHVVSQMIDLMNTDKSKALKVLDPILVHSYKSKDGQLLCEITVTPEMYNQKPTGVIKMSDEEMYENLQETAKFLNPTSPIEIDEDVYLSEVKAFRPRTLEFTYEMADVDVADLDTVIFKDILIPALSEDLKKDSSDKELKDNDVVFRYVYFDKNKAYICAVDITPEQYK